MPNDFFCLNLLLYLIPDRTVKVDLSGYCEQLQKKRGASFGGLSFFTGKSVEIGNGSVEHVVHFKVYPLQFANIGLTCKCKYL